MINFVLGKLLFYSYLARLLVYNVLVVVIGCTYAISVYQH
jgi:hypothetical protein